MGKSINLKCKCCSHEVNIQWGSEFYVSSDGGEKSLSSSGTGMENINGVGISGFWVDKICKNCGELIKESRYIEDATEEYTVAWMNFPRVDIIEACTACGSKDILTMYEIISEDAEIPCAKCREGNMLLSSIT